MGMPRKRDIYLAGCSFINKGPEAMVLTAAGALRNHFPKTGMCVRTPLEYCDIARDNGLLPVRSDYPHSVVGRLRSKMQMVRLFRRAILVDIGGYQFGDPWGEEHAWRKLRSVKYFKKSGSPVFFMPQTWGPFSCASLGEAVREIVRNADLVFARDKGSFAELQKLVGPNHSNVFFAHDLAWGFQGADLSFGREMLRKLGLEVEGSTFTVCITPNLRVYERSAGTGSDNAYMKVLCQIIRHLCSKHDAQIVLMGHELRLSNVKTPDDRLLCGYLVESLGPDLPVVHMNQYLPAAQVKSIIGNCDLVISSRYHGLIAALSQGVPAAAIGWAHKYDELFAEFDLSANLLSLSKSEAEVLGDIDAIVGRLPEIAKKILPVAEMMKKSGQEAISQVIRKIEGSS